MKKALRIVLLVLAIIATVYCVFVSIMWTSRMISFLKFDFEWSDLSFQNEMKLIIGNLISSIFGVFFSLLYIIFTFKNGLGKEIYHYAYLTIEEIRNNRDKKRKEDIKNTINALNEELETIENNTKSD